MTTKQLFSKFELLEQRLRSNQYLLGALGILSKFQDEIVRLHSNSLVQNNTATVYNAVTATQARLGAIIQETKKYSPIRILKEIDNVLVAFTEAEEGFDSETHARFNSVKTELEAFRNAYERFILAQQLAETAQLLTIAQRVDVAINSSLMFVSVVLKNLCPETLPEKSGDQIEIYLASEIDFETFIEKISSLEKTYEELCHLFNVSSKQEPLRIIKVESGTIWAWLKGNAAAVTAMRSLIEKAAHYFYRNHTDEGKLSTIPKNVATIESVLHLSDELKKRDISTEKLDEHLKKASIAIGSQLEKLLSDEDEIELNGEVIALTPNSQQKLISQKKIKLIENKTGVSPS